MVRSCLQELETLREGRRLQDR